MSTATAQCTICAAEPSPGFYTGCLIADGHGDGKWLCDGKGNLTQHEVNDCPRDRDEEQAECLCTENNISFRCPFHGALTLEQHTEIVKDLRDAAAWLDCQGTRDPRTATYASACRVAAHELRSHALLSPPDQASA